MRSYPRNSPQAAARVIALVLLADGHLSRTELAALERHDLARRLGLDASALAQGLKELVEDLLAGGGAGWHGTAALDEGIICAVLREVDEPALRQEVLALCLAVAQADSHLGEGEQALLALIGKRWGQGACEPA